MAARPELVGDAAEGVGELGGRGRFRRERRATGTGAVDGDREERPGQCSSRPRAQQSRERADRDGTAEPPPGRRARARGGQSIVDAVGDHPLREAGQRAGQCEQGGAHHGTAVPRRASSAPSTSRSRVRPDPRTQTDRTATQPSAAARTPSASNTRLTGGQATHVQHDLDCCGELAVQCRAREPACRREGLHASGHLLRRVGVHGACAAVVAGVQRGEQLADLGAADLPDDQSIGPHPQRLPNEVAKLDAARALDVGRP